MVDPHELATLTVYEAQFPLFAHGHPRVVPVAVAIGRRQCFRYWRFGFVEEKATNSGQSIDDFLAFRGQLRGVVEMLPLAAGALPEVRTGRLDAIRGSLKDFHHNGRRILAVHPHHLGNNAFAGYAAEHKNELAIVAAQCLPETSPRLQGNVDALAGTHSGLVFGAGLRRDMGKLFS